MTTPADTVSRAAEAPASLRTLVERFDHDAFDLPGERAVIRLATEGEPAWDVEIDRFGARLEKKRSGDPDALLTADPPTWDGIAEDVASGMAAFRRGRLRVRRNLHLGVGFLAATS